MRFAPLLIGGVAMFDYKENIPLSDRRLLTFKDFCTYSGLHCSKAREFLKETNIIVSFGERTNLIDRKKFDDWCVKQTGYSLAKQQEYKKQSVFASRRHKTYERSIK